MNTEILSIEVAKQMTSEGKKHISIEELLK